MCLFDTHCSLFDFVPSDRMHRPDHASVLPDHVAPMPMPDSPREAEMLLILLDMGLYPKIAPAKSEKIPPDEG